MAEGCSDAVLAAWQRAAGRSSSVARTAGVRRGCCLHGSLDARRNGSCHALMAVVCLQPAPPPPLLTVGAARPACQPRPL